MPLFFREYTITDEGGKIHAFKHYPNQEGKIVVEKDELDSSLRARRDLITLISTASSYMDDNTICKVEINEGEDDV